MQNKKNAQAAKAPAKPKLLFPVLAIAVSLLVLVGALVYLLFALPKLSRNAQTVESPAPSDEASVLLRDYAASQFPDYRFVSYDAETAVLTLEYPLNAEFEKLQKHGVAAGYAELAQDTLFNAVLLRDGCVISCQTNVAEVVVRAMSSDGLEVYRASSLSGVTACWDK